METKREIKYFTIMEYEKEQEYLRKKHKEEYVQMFQDCGWEYIMDFVGYSYFRKPVCAMKDKEEEIFCDDGSRLDMMQRVFRGRMLPLLAIFCGCLLPQFITQISLDTGFNKGVAGILGAMIILYVVIFAHYGIEYMKYKKKLGR